MKNRNLLSAILLIAIVVIAAICYVVLFSNYETIWFEFAPIFYLCLITFFLAIGIFVCAILVDKKNK